MKLFCKSGVIHHRHYPHVSAVVFTLLSFTVLGVGFPMLLLAQEGGNFSSPGTGTPGTGGQGPANNQPNIGGTGPSNNMGPNNGPNMGGDQGFGGQGPANNQPNIGGTGPSNNMGPNNQPGFKVRGGQQNMRQPQSSKSGRNNQSGQRGPQNQGPQGDGMQTCNVNGEELQGSCDQYNNMNGEGGDQGFGGPSEEEMDKQRQQNEARMLKEMQRNLKGPEQGIKMFEKQIAQLTKKGIAVPANVTEAVEKIKAVLVAVKNAKTFEEAQAAGLEDMQELFQTLDESRQQLEMLARWPQTIKQLNQDLKRLNSELKRDRSIVAKLIKQGIDLTEELSAFESAVAGLQAVRDDADSRMKSGDSEGAFSALEEGFFGAMEDIWEKDRIIKTMSNLGRFTSDFKRGIADANRMIKMLKRKKIDTSSLEDLLAQAQEKGNEVLGWLKSKPVDADAVMSGLQELEDLRQQFEQTADELTGAKEEMPWEKGPQQFKQLQQIDMGKFGF